MGETKQVDVKVGIDVVLNGGKEEMNSATIPIEWWLSKEVIEKDPQYVLFFEQNGTEKSYHDGSAHGRRYVCKITDAFKFLQLFSPGYHRVMVIAISGEDRKVEDMLWRYLRKQIGDEYFVSLDWEAAKNNDLQGQGYEECLVASTVKEFEVPQELFAKKPETNLGRLIWKWVNLCFENDPRDECNYLERKILAFMLQPFLVIFWYFLKYLLVGTLHASYILLVSFATLFVGFRPRPVLKEMWGAFTFTRCPRWGVKKFGRYDFTFAKTTFRLWSITKVERDGKFENVLKYMPITPLLATLIMGAVVGLYFLIRFFLVDVLSVTLISLGIVAVIAFVFVVCEFLKYLNKTAPGRREKRRLKTIEAEKERMTYQELTRKRMLESFDLSKKTDEVFLDRTPPDLQGKVIQKFRVSYWTLKAKVCKPFSK